MGLSDQRQSDVSSVVHAAIDAGTSSIDTAPLYGSGRCESLLAKAIAGKRDRIQLLSKCGLRWDARHGERMFWINLAGKRCWVRKDARPRSIRLGIEQSLRRMNVDAIDLMQIHHWDRSTPLSASLEELDRAREAGKIKAIGISNFPLQQCREAKKMLGSHLFSIQDELSLVVRSRSCELTEFCRRTATHFLAYSPLRGGALAGKYLANESALTTLTDEECARIKTINLALRDSLVPLADNYAATAGQIALAWILTQPGVSSVIAGASQPHQAVRNAEAARIALDVEQAKELAAAFADCAVEAAPPAAPAGFMRQRLSRALQRLIGGRFPVR